MLSLIVPTFNERENIAPLYERTLNAIGDEPFEIIFVDDSLDNTPAEIRRIAQLDPRVRLLHREERGLASAVVCGLGAARGDLVAVIDGDLQHPPEVLPRLVAAQRATGADLVVPSRYMPGGDPGGLSPIRHLLSVGGKLVAQVVLSEARDTTDPLSGCFLATRDTALALRGTKPRGFKILLELLVRAAPQRVVDLPYRFMPRVAEHSKLGWKTQVLYLSQLLELVPLNPDNTRFFLFALIGGTGVAVNAALFMLLNPMLLGGTVPFPTVMASLAASHAAMAWNFIWNTSITWRDRYRSDLLWRFAMRYLVVSEIGAAVTAVVLELLRGIGLRVDIVGQLVGIAASVLATYRLNDRWTWPRELGLQASRPIRR